MNQLFTVAKVFLILLANFTKKQICIFCFINFWIALGNIFAIQAQSTPGSNDASFNTADVVVGAGEGFSGSVITIVQLNDGKKLVGGTFTSYNGSSRNRIARLNADGTLDASFNPGTGFNGEVRSLSLQPDGKVLVGGSFTSFNGTPRSFIARL
ncbi:delta-60 repeat domain-containing protein, partial [Pontibacter roseus]|uniref:delta-60 repeat domain-containing protein n=1 Tax=Pontibacter roseus TaxID=336989 RepID=UPI0005260324